MPSRLDDNKGTLQLLLAVQRQDALKFGMHGTEGRRQNPKVDNSGAAALDEDKCPEIAVARHEDSPLLMGGSQQFGVFRLGQA
jgi:hypothetical protein